MDAERVNEVEYLGKMVIINGLRKILSYVIYII